MATKKTTKKATRRGRKPATEKVKEQQAVIEKQEALIQQLAQANSRHVQHAAESRRPVQLSELMVGIRNISDYTLGAKSPYPDVERDLHLHGDVGVPDPGTIGIVSYSWWQQLRRGPLMDRGMIMRDDSALGTLHTAAPADKPEEIAPNWHRNAVIDPVEWVESRTDMEIQRDIAKMTSGASLRRIRRVVDDKIRELQDTMRDDPKRAEKAVRMLPAKLALIDQITTERLERDESLK